ncbi:hypothetical protein [Fimbriiglobus ruber]|uniref:hypothetical protein n=1 Tax=Fimbriiglobus ruber TaxID=1908690 RepID=UPI001179DAB2|nr:hypothetical protein [Fimbriiglobus ruber]
MRYRLFILIAAILSARFSCSVLPFPDEICAQHAEFPLAGFAGLDLKTLDEGGISDLKKAWDSCLPEEYRTTHSVAYPPIFVWHTKDKEGQKGYVVLQKNPVEIFPSASYVSAHTFDHSGKRLDSVNFPTGWRILVQTVNFRYEPTLQGHIIEMGSAPWNLGRSVRRQVYGILRDRLVLLWLEGPDGGLIPNIYYAPNHTIGPPQPNRSAEQWAEALTSDHPMVVLEALSWLGGTHRLSLSDTPKDQHWENLESTKLIVTVRRRPDVITAVEELARSSNPWLRQAAILAIEQMTAQVNW